MPVAADTGPTVLAIGSIMTGMMALIMVSRIVQYTLPQMPTKLCMRAGGIHKITGPALAFTSVCATRMDTTHITGT